MKANQLKNQEEHLRRWSQEFQYPPTPDIAGAVANRLQEGLRPAASLRPRLAWGALTVLFLLAALLAVPPVRAQVLEFLQIGAIRIFLAEPTQTPTQVVTRPSALAGQPGGPVVSATPRHFPAISDLAGETSLAEAQSQLGFPIRLPAYPPDLGEPDRVFLQDLGGQAVLLIWMVPEEPSRIRLDLLVFGPDSSAKKFLPEPSVIEETTVNSRPAVWTVGPHSLQLGGNAYDQVNLVVQGNVLMWEEDRVTYRLETDLPLPEAVRIAESLQAAGPVGESVGAAKAPITATPSPEVLALENCPVTQPQDPPFSPPPPYPSQAPYKGEFWYGEDVLWTMLKVEGAWFGLPYHEQGGGHYVQKVFWWNKDYDWYTEPQPEFKVTARRLDGPALTYETTQATNAYHPDFGSAILTGVEIPTLGCWEFTGSYRGQSLSFVVWIAP